MVNENRFDRFAYSASHDLKQPLRNVRSFANVLTNHLRQNSSLDENSEEYLNYILDSISSMEVLVNDLSTFSTLDARLGQKSVLQLTSFLELEEFKLNDRHPDLNISIKHDSLPELEVYPEIVKILFQKLIANAVKFRSEPNVNISITGKETADAWEFSIEDNGIGINQNFDKDIFQPFVKYHTSSEVMGSGLGLAICKKAIELHDGKIWYDLNKEQGTTFHFNLKKSKDRYRANLEENGQRNTSGY